MGWPSDTKKNSRLVMLYWIHNNMVEVPPAYHPPLRLNQPSRGHQAQFVRLNPEIDAYKYSFLPRTIVDWNTLDENSQTPIFHIFPRPTSFTLMNFPNLNQPSFTETCISPFSLSWFPPGFMFSPDFMSFLYFGLFSCKWSTFFFENPPSWDFISRRKILPIFPTFGR